jgi:hypothetical protein
VTGRRKAAAVINFACRNRSFPALVAALIFSFCSCNGSSQKVPREFRSFMPRSSHPVEYRETIPFYEDEKLVRPAFLSRMEAMEDIDMFEYLFNTSYSGLEYWEHRGVDFESCFAGLRSSLQKRDTISSYEFERELSTILKRIYDGHIALIGSGYNHAYRHKTIYYCDILVEKTSDGSFKVIDSRFEGVKTGDLFTQKDGERYLFRTLSPPGTYHYLIGAFSFDVVTGERLSFNNKSIQVPFHKSRLLYARFSDTEPFHVERESNIPIIRAAGFEDRHYPKMKEFMESGNEFKNEYTLIVNLFNNGGGSSAFPETFIRNLNGISEWKTDWAVLTSPAITQYYFHYDVGSIPDMSPEPKYTIASNSRKYEQYRKSPVKSWEFGSSPGDNASGHYGGTLFVLANRRVLSAGEAMVGYSRSVKNRILIGENTGGVVQFSDAQQYLLPNSRFIVKLPRRLLLVPGFEECVGFVPDYWLDSMEPMQEVLRWLNDPEHYRFAYSCGYDEMVRKNGLAPALPPDMHIAPPSSKVPKTLRAFSGKWFGVSDGILDHVLVVERIHDNLDVDAVYSWGVAYQWDIDRPGWERFRGKFQNGSLILTDENRGIRISYTLNSSGALDAIYERPGVYSRATLTRADD